MRKTIIAGNWKMNGTLTSVRKLAQDISSIDYSPEKIDVIVFPSSIYLSEIETCLNSSSVLMGSQNLNENDEGAFTGEVSGKMLKEFNCKYVLVGHSERRHLYGETNEIVALKFMQAIKSGLTPILCVGETKEEKEKNKTQEVIEKQLSALIKLGGLALLEKAMIAYEPVWAIGTGLSASKEDADLVHKFIRDWLKVKEVFSDNISILYGGSVKKENASQLISMPNIDGLLIGGASLDAEQFKGIVQCIN